MHKSHQILLTLTLVGSLSTLTVASQQVAADPIKEKLDAVQKLDDMGGKAETMQAVAILKALKDQKMTDDQHDTWLRYSRDFALRAADLKWLKSLGKEDSPFSMDQVYTVLYGYGKLTTGDLDGAEKVFKSVDMGRLNVRDQRRIFGLEARIAHLRGDTKTELVNIEQIIEHLPSWPSRTCQSCHDSPKVKDKPTALPLSRFWFGERYAELMAANGTATQVRDEALKSLKANPKDDLARIRLGYALLALGKKDESQKTFEQLPYAEAAGRDLPKARMLFAFP